MTYREALERMCNRCSAHGECHGTGCHPKRVLEELIKEIEDDK